MADEKSPSPACKVFSLLLQAIQTAAALGILVILALLLVEFKKITDPNYVLPIQSPNELSVRIGQTSLGSNNISPFFVETVTGV